MKGGLAFQLPSPMRSSVYASSSFQLFKMIVFHIKISNLKFVTEMFLECGLRVDLLTASFHWILSTGYSTGQYPRYLLLDAYWRVSNGESLVERFPSKLLSATHYPTPVCPTVTAMLLASCESHAILQRSQNFPNFPMYHKVIHNGSCLDHVCRAA